ncbi:hypothetical protein [Amycolatopsis nigrescens]|uniref:hypothetical protein n=1 Tax=Amycolatopsis nigrescens TaxID=381445 RepID=UPI000379EF31|nr:hypothetical protein [Amycolatopsis nigrescens]
MTKRALYRGVLTTLAAAVLALTALASSASADPGAPASGTLTWSVKPVALPVPVDRIP